MRTCLAAAGDLSSPDLLPEGWSAGATLVHLEGYILYKPELASAALRSAREAGSLVCSRPLPVLAHTWAHVCSLAVMSKIAEVLH
jgi:sugar/nucleoside kinase (ribokinase family)